MYEQKLGNDEGVESQLEEALDTALGRLGINLDQDFDGKSSTPDFVDLVRALDEASFRALRVQDKRPAFETYKELCAEIDAQIDDLTEQVILKEALKRKFLDALKAALRRLSKDNQVTEIEKLLDYLRGESIISYDQKQKLVEEFLPAE
ncbi:MAG: hypothetical protein GF390_01770 [Candidatus Pacebacteria bacterium]|nr:hypothetical protein [Candidatus Paceibacterota bacterium]